MQLGYKQNTGSENLMKTAEPSMGFGLEDAMRPVSRTTVFCSLVLLSSAAVLRAQSTLGDISGAVRDASGASVPNASVVLVNTDTGITSTLSSGSDGSYRFQQVQPGHYRLQVTAAGFSKTDVGNILINLDGHLTQDVTLAVGSTGEVVQVDGYSPQINTEATASAAL